MNLQVLFCLIAVLGSVFGQQSGCKGPVFKVNGVNQIREVLKTNLNSAASLSYDSSTNTLFFSYRSDKNVYSVLFGKFNLNNNEFETISGVEYQQIQLSNTLSSNSFISIEYIHGETAVDAKTNNVYIQSTGGFYRYNKNTNRPELCSAKDSNIASYAYMLFVKSDIIYYATDPNFYLFIMENGVASKFKDLETNQVRELVIDDYDNIYIANDTGLYRQKIGSQKAVYYKESKGLVDGLVINQVGDVYAYAGSSGVYAISRNTNVMEKILDDTVLGLTFDGGYNMVYSDKTNLFILKPNNDPNCV
ncbi:ommochrome-binding protein-like [Choristoneura fumiferana]|uniref:ommochrome-binding protein-like n=1 Tax=Choristoneura fumiferana TaxID=7141 RepID=UPI003D15C695